MAKQDWSGRLDASDALFAVEKDLALHATVPLGSSGAGPGLHLHLEWAGAADSTRDALSWRFNGLQLAQDVDSERWTADFDAILARQQAYQRELEAIYRTQEGEEDTGARRDVITDVNEFWGSDDDDEDEAPKAVASKDAGKTQEDDDGYWDSYGNEETAVGDLPVPSAESDKEADSLLISMRGIWQLYKSANAGQDEATLQSRFLEVATAATSAPASGA